MRDVLDLRGTRLTVCWFLSLLVACVTVACSTSPVTRLFVMSAIPVTAAVPVDRLSDRLAESEAPAVAVMTT